MALVDTLIAAQVAAQAALDHILKQQSDAAALKIDATAIPALTSFTNAVNAAKAIPIPPAASAVGP